MMLDDFLNRQKIETLQRFEQFWIEARRITSSKAALLYKLRRAMLDAPTLMARLETLPSPERKLLEIIVYSSDRSRGTGEFLAAGMDNPAHPGRMGQFLSHLAEKGLIDYEPDDRPGEPRNSVFVPEELAKMLRQLLRSDFRPPDVLLSLESFCLYGGRAQPSGPQAPRRPAREDKEQGKANAALLSQNRILDRLKAIENDELRDVVRTTMAQYGGLIPLSAIRKLKPRADAKLLAAWKEELERLHLGTTGSLHLEHLGFNIRDEYLILFLEVVKAGLQEWSSDGEAEKYSCASYGFALFLDFCHLLQRVQQEDLRMTKTDALRRHGSEATIQSLLLARAKSSDEATAYLERLLSLAFDLELVQRLPDGILAITSQAMEWQAKPVHQKIRDVYGSFLYPDTNGIEPSHADLLRLRFGACSKAFQPGRWYPVSVAARMAVADYLLALIRGEIESGPMALQTIQTMPVGLDTLAEDFARWLETQALPWGMVDIAYSGKKPALVRTTPVTACLFHGGVSFPEGSPRPLIVNPDFEVVLFPAETPPEVHLLVHQIATLNKIDQVFHYRIEAASVTNAAAMGVSGETMIEILERNSRGPVPQNVRYSIKAWTSRVHLAKVEQVYILELKSPELTQQVRNLPGIRHLVIRELGPCILALQGPPEDRAAVRALQELGIFLRRG